MKFFILVALPVVLAASGSNSHRFAVEMPFQFFKPL